ncbi:hypothetical protein [Alysiella filiformis]|uniref:Uncharacterized protein n=1 Tax=Alysiella filiformis DSM 16848 TaxID=1120981 RepID=A0A286ED69_9NEIS|nr:hypothetical protein [Alysiella filiformis]QMT31925.1 hypothetical protein H3L97_03340 [Alysiella filiformis]UBQ57168.1 hypothetical protein JF568_05335 [Alysiella filiformis DSM 16848]SOD68774.1 hypothetical protein SAMN02746062_01398 [Alysiella filiformis DSM 16848]
MSYESESKLTFGNILLGLLLLGVVVVIGLIVFVYFALTKQSNNKNTILPTDAPPSQSIDRLSPDGRALPSVPRAQASGENAKPKTAANATDNTTANSHGDKIAKELNGDNAAINARDVAIAPERPARTERPKPIYKPKPKPAVANNNDADSANSERNTGERTLTPTNKIAGERTLEPTNKPRFVPRSDSTSGERPIQPSNRTNTSRSTRNDDASSGSRSSGSRNSDSFAEKPLKPLNKPRSNGGGDNIDNLF